MTGLMARSPSPVPRTASVLARFGSRAPPRDRASSLRSLRLAHGSAALLGSGEALLAQVRRRAPRREPTGRLRTTVAAARDARGGRREAEADEQRRERRHVARGDLAAGHRGLALAGVARAAPRGLNADVERRRQRVLARLQVVHLDEVPVAEERARRLRALCLATALDLRLAARVAARLALDLAVHVGLRLAAPLARRLAAHRRARRG